MTPTRPLKRRGRDWARAGRGTSLRALERELVQKAKQRLDETIAQIRAAASWTCSDGSLDADWQRLATFSERILDDIKLALAKYR